MSSCFGVPGWACEYTMMPGNDYDKAFINHMRWGQHFYEALTANRATSASNVHGITTWDPLPLEHAIEQTLQASDVLGAVYFLDGRLLSPWEYRVWKKQKWTTPRLDPRLFGKVAGEETVRRVPPGSQLVRLGGIRRSADTANKGALDTLVSSYGLDYLITEEGMDRAEAQSIVVGDIVHCACGLLLGNHYVQRNFTDNVVAGWAVTDGWLTVDIGYVREPGDNSCDPLSREVCELDLHGHTLVKVPDNTGNKGNSGGIETYWDHLDATNSCPIADFVEEKTPPTIEDVQRCVELYYGITPGEMKGFKRIPHYSKHGSRVEFARRMAMYLTRYCTDASLEDIAEAFSVSDTSHVTRAVIDITNHKRDDPSLEETIEDLIRQI